MALFAAAWGSERIRLGVSSGYYPLSFEEDGEVRGMLVDVGREVAAKMGMAAEVVAYDWVDMPSVVGSGEVDVFLGVFYSDERAELYEFGPELYSSDVFFYSRDRAGAVRSLSEADGLKVGVSFPGSLIPLTARAEYPDVQWVVFNDSEELLNQMMIDDSFVGFVEEAVLVEAMRLSRAGLEPFSRSDEPFFSLSLRAVARKGNSELMLRFSAAFSQLDRFELARLSFPWFSGKEVYEGPIGLTPEELDFLRRHPQIRFGGDANWPPISFRNERGVPDGMQADFLRLIEELIGVQFDYVLFEDWQAVQRSVDEGLADLRSAEAGQENATISYLQVPLALVVHSAKKKGYNLDGLAGEVISVEAGNVFARRFADRYPDTNFRFVVSEQEGLAQVLRGEVDGHVGNLAVCSHLIQTGFASALSIVDTLDFSHDLAFEVRSDGDWPVFKDIMDRAISQISEAQRKEIRDRWIAVDLRERFDYESLWKPLLAVAAVLLLAVLWRWSNWRFRKALNSAQERLFLANKAGAGGVVEWFPCTGVLKYSEEYYNILGYKVEELEEDISAFRKLAHPDDFRAAMLSQWKAVKLGDEFEVTLRMRHKSGDWVWVLSRGIPTHFEPDGSVRRFLTVHTDITALMRTRQELEKQERIAREANNAKSVFLANMSHEIRTPMNAILGFSRLLKRDSSLNTQQSGYVHLINRSGEHLLSLLDDILDIAKIESGRMEVDWNDWDIKRVFSDLSFIYAGRCEEKGLRFESSYAEDLPAVVESDGAKLRQVLANLLVNAVKFTDQGSIGFTASRVSEDGESSRIRIEISDTGCGISEDEIPLLFKTFSQAAGGKGEKSGSGLGLTIAREYARLMGGDLRVTSELGKGSRFTLELPLRPAKGESTINDELLYRVSIDQELAGAKRVLVVDDNLYSLQYMQQFLAACGFFVRLAQDGEEAVEVWSKFSPDVVLLDLRMPKKDGYEVIREIRASSGPNHPKILVLTASAFKDQRQRVLDMGADEFMGKPFREAELLEKLAELLELPFERESLEEESSAESLSSTGMDKSIELDEATYLKFVDACRGGYVQKLGELIDSLDCNQPEAAMYLRRCAQSFDYGKILNMLTVSPDSANVDQK